MERVTYNPDVFAVADLEQARRIILTPTDLPTDERWRRETPYLADLIHREIVLSPENLLVDYGCGVGRMSGALVRAAGCRVLGVDISPQMRALAAAQEPDPRFAAVSRGLLESLVRHGLQADAAIAVWVLQHIPQVEHDAALLRAALKPGAPLLIVNNSRRAIPGKEAPWSTTARTWRRSSKPRGSGRTGGDSSIPPQSASRRRASPSGRFIARRGPGGRPPLAQESEA